MEFHDLLKLSSKLTVTSIIRLYLKYRVYLLRYWWFISEVCITRSWNSMYSSTFFSISKNRDSRGWPVKSLCPRPLTSIIRFTDWSSPIAAASASCITVQSHEKALDACNPWLRSVCSRNMKNLWKNCILLACFIPSTNSCARWLTMLVLLFVWESIPLALHLWNRTSETIACPVSPISSIPCREGQEKAASSTLVIQVLGWSRVKSPCFNPC